VVRQVHADECFGEAATAVLRGAIQPFGGVPVVVRLALPLEAVDETLGNFRRNLWLWSLVILILAGAISLLVSRSFTERVERLREFSRAWPKAISGRWLRMGQETRWKRWGTH